MTDDELAALAPLLLPHRERLEALWARRRDHRATLSSAEGGPARTPAGTGADLLTTQAAAARLSCSRSHIYSLVVRGELAWRDISATDRTTKLRVVAASLDDYIARGHRRGVGPAAGTATEGRS